MEGYVASHTPSLTQAEVEQLIHRQLAANSQDVFAQEGVRNFYAELKVLINECFQNLYDVVRVKYPDEQAVRFTAGLHVFDSADLSNIMDAEVQRALDAFPTIKKEYALAMGKFAQALHNSVMGSVSVKFPKFETFLLDLYRRLAHSREMRDMTYFMMDFTAKEIFMKDQVRMSMRANIEIKEPNLPAHIMPSDSVSNIASLRTKKPQTVLTSSMLDAASRISSRSHHSHHTHHSNHSQRPHRRPTQQHNTPSHPPSHPHRGEKALTAFSLERHSNRTSDRAPMGAPSVFVTGDKPRSKSVYMEVTVPQTNPYAQDLDSRFIDVPDRSDSDSD